MMYFTTYVTTKSVILNINNKFCCCFYSFLLYHNIRCYSRNCCSQQILLSFVLYNNHFHGKFFSGFLFHFFLPTRRAVRCFFLSRVSFSPSLALFSFSCGIHLHLRQRQTDCLRPASQPPAHRPTPSASNTNGPTTDSPLPFRTRCIP